MISRTENRDPAFSRRQFLALTLFAPSGLRWWMPLSLGRVTQSWTVSDPRAKWGPQINGGNVDLRSELNKYRALGFVTGSVDDTHPPGNSIFTAEAILVLAQNGGLTPEDL